MAKKILISAFDFPPQWGGVATYSLELAKALSKKGYDVTVVTKKLNKDFIDPEDFKIIRYNLGQSGISSIPKLTWHLFRLLKKEKFDHMFCCLWLPDATSVYLAKKLAQVDTPYSISVHAMEILESKENIKKRFRQRLKPLKQNVFSNAHRLLCVSQYTRKLLLSLVSIDESKAIVVNNGANPDIFTPAKQKTKNFPTIFTACRLVPNKGIDQVIKSLPDLLKKHPKLKYRIAGEGPDLTRLKKLASMMQVDQSIEFLGKIGLEDLIVEFQQADLFVMLSRKERHHVEGFGLVFLEAALCGTPSLGGKSGGIPDAIEDGITGWLVDPYSESQITSKMVELLNSPKLLEQVGASALTRTKQGKTWNHRVEQIIKEVGLDA